jgi:DNA-directed RNA polymerase subunit RPC12/RpoP
MQIVENKIWQAKIECPHCGSSLIIYKEDIEITPAIVGESNEKYDVHCPACGLSMKLDPATLEEYKESEHKLQLLFIKMRQEGYFREGRLFIAKRP